MRLQIPKRGITAVEAVIGISLAGIIIVFAMNAVNQFINGGRDVTQKTQALYLAEEGLELARYLKDNNWTNISTLALNTPHYFEITPASIKATTTPETIGPFSRSFTLQNVYRNSSSDDIVASTTWGSVPDPDSKYVTVNLTWGSGQGVSLTSILADTVP
jgi:type II secretory pathway pseudopilin PulG